MGLCFTSGRPYAILTSTRGANFLPVNTAFPYVTTSYYCEGNNRTKGLNGKCGASLSLWQLASSNRVLKATTYGSTIVVHAKNCPRNLYIV